MAKQTAIDYLLANYFNVDYTEVKALIEKAKEMEKRQMEDAYGQGLWDAEKPRSQQTFGMFKKYYEETYNFQEDEV
jgi:hypothetical protein